jgi:hypothetical protein
LLPVSFLRQSADFGRSAQALRNQSVYADVRSAFTSRLRSNRTISGTIRASSDTTDSKSVHPRKQKSRRAALPQFPFGGDVSAFNPLRSSARLSASFAEAK